jgi:outer membrane biosynthesis protein TonB
MHNEQHLSALEHGHRHGLALAKHKHQTSQDLRNAAMQEAEQQANQGEGQGGAVPAGGGAEIGDQAGNAAASSPGMGPSGPSSATPPTPQVPPTPPTQQAPPAHSASDERLSRLEALVEKMSRPRKRRVLRDEHGRLAGVEDYE